MTVTTLHHPLPEPGTSWHALWARVHDRARRRLAHWRAQRTQRQQARIALAIEHELRQLDARTLCDIGAPQGLVGQRRWQDEQDAWMLERTLRSHGL
jgi:hypothetical protein